MSTLISPDVSVCDDCLAELLGFDPLYLANEGKLQCFVAQEDADAVLAAIAANPYGRDATMIGEVVTDHAAKVLWRRGSGASEYWICWQEDNYHESVSLY